VRLGDHWYDIRALRYPGMLFNLDQGLVTLRYELETDTEPLRFEEMVRLPIPGQPVADDVLAAVTRCLELLYIAAGTSYYKIAAPPVVMIDSVRLSEKALSWVEAVFRDGLAEFAYNNDLAHVLDVEITAAADAVTPVTSDISGRRPLVAIGGGKDSIVSTEATRVAGMDPVLFAVNPNAIIKGVFDMSGQPSLTARRELDNQLFTLNANGAYNGHVPVTAINSLIAVSTSLLNGLGPVVMSNESSASIPNTRWHGHDINHQWSKGLAAEQLLREALEAHVGYPDIYFSLLRGMSELHITKLFATISAYDHVVTSCNRAYKLRDASARWCRQCPKCRFVFLALAPFTTPARLIDIFGGDMLSDETQLPGYRELIGLTGHKPFECVGDTEECLVALGLLAGSAEWKDRPVVRQLVEEVPTDGWPTEASIARVFAGDGPSFAPPAYRQALEALGQR
jgi:hypothetical protein